MKLYLDVSFESHVALSDDDRLSVEALTLSCKRYDGVDPAMYFDTHLNVVPGLKAWFLAWGKGHGDSRVLVAAARIFAPSRQEAELSVAVKPPYRRQGLFRALMAMTRQALCQAGVVRLLLAVDARRGYGALIADSLGAVRSHGEHMMSLLRDEFTPQPDGPVVRLVAVDECTVDTAVDISVRAFGDDPSDARTFIEQAMKDDEREQFLVFSQDGPIGAVSCALHDGAMLHGLGVVPEYRGRGFGGAILDTAAQLLFRRGYKEVSLEVDDQNSAALALYRSRGFCEQSKIDYWNIRLDSDTMNDSTGGQACI